MCIYTCILYITVLYIHLFKWSVFQHLQKNEIITSTAWYQMKVNHSFFPSFPLFQQIPISKAPQKNSEKTKKDKTTKHGSYQNNVAVVWPWYALS